ARFVCGQGGEAQLSGPLTQPCGAPRGGSTFKGRSPTTAENAIFSLQLAMPKPAERWLLVTSAYHMPRAMGVFRKAGFAVEAYPVDYRTRGGADLLIPFDDVASGLRRTDTAARAWIGPMA